MMYDTAIHEHMDVIGSDGGHVGRVDKLVGEEIELTKFALGSGLKHHMIPLSWIDHVDEHVHLNVTRETARATWREKH